MLDTNLSAHALRGCSDRVQNLPLIVYRETHVLKSVAALTVSLDSSTLSGYSDIIYVTYRVRAAIRVKVQTEAVCDANLPSW